MSECIRTALKTQRPKGIVGSNPTEATINLERKIMLKLYYYQYGLDFLVTIAQNKNEAKKKFMETLDEDFDWDEGEGEEASTKELVCLYTKEYKGNVMYIIKPERVSVPPLTVR